MNDSETDDAAQNMDPLFPERQVRSDEGELRTLYMKDITYSIRYAKCKGGLLGSIFIRPTKFDDGDGISSETENKEGDDHLLRNYDQTCFQLWCPEEETEDAVEHLFKLVTQFLKREAYMINFEMTPTYADRIQELAIVATQVHLSSPRKPV